jgi:hypothetical protein
VNLILYLLIFLLLLVILIFTVSLRLKFIFDTEKSNMNLKLFWLNPFLKVLITMENMKPIFRIHLFNKEVYKGSIRENKNKTNGRDLIKVVKPKEIHINTNYGFRDPFTTGVACGAINVASQLINIDSIQQNPDFMAEADYFRLDATANLNIGSTLINLYRANKS